MSSTVPVIDIGGPRARAAAEIDAACRDVGFFQVVGHGVDPEVAAQMWSTARSFFDLPLVDRMSAARPHPGYPYGYVPLAGEALARSLGHDTPPDVKETFNAGPPMPTTTPATGGVTGRDIVDPDERELFGPTPWPPALPQMQSVVAAYFTEMDGLAQRLMALFATALGLASDRFAASIDRAPGALRALNYPDQSAVPPPGQLRAGAHTDYGTLTILRQQAAPGGLEVRLAQRPDGPDGSDGSAGGDGPEHGDGPARVDGLSGVGGLSSAEHWVPVPSIPDALVINIGDLLARWTNDRWCSTLHRVVNPPTDADGSTRRQSIAFFHNANFDCEVRCLPTCLEPGEAPRYPPVVAGRHLVSKFRSTDAPP